MKFSIELTEEEGTALLQLLDHAVKAQGLSVAGPAAVLGQKIQAAHQAAIKDCGLPIADCGIAGRGEGRNGMIFGSQTES